MSLKKKTIRGLKWSGVSQVTKQISQFIITAILARLLSPEDFGLIGMAMVFTGFAMIFNELGISSALIQKQNTHEEHLSSAFWLNILVGFFLMVLFIALAPVIAWFYKKPILQPVISVMSVGFFISGFTVVQQAIITKRMDFKSLSIRDIVATTVGGAVGIVMALRGFGLWSLVGQFLMFTFLNSSLLWFISDWRPKFIFSRVAVKDIFHFSANLTGFNVVNYFARNVDYLLIGKFLGSEALGFYTLAYKLMMLPLQNISWVITKVMFPAFSKIHQDLKKVQDNYLNLIYVISLVSFPTMITLFFLSSDLIVLIFGHKWVAVIPVIKVFCFCGMVQAIATTVGVIYQSQGRPDIQLKFSLFISIPSVVIAVMLGMKKGIYYIALFYTIRTFIVAVLSFAIMGRLIGLKWKRIIETLFANVFFTFAIFCGGALLSSFIQKINMGQWPRMILLSGYLFAAYLAFYLFSDILNLKKKLVN